MILPLRNLSNKSHAWVFVNGDCDQPTLDRLAISNDDLLVCVDGGLRHCQQIGLTPHVLVGDLDSAEPQAAEAVRRSEAIVLEYAVEKNETDLELALHYLEDQAIGSITLVGFTGGRLDHSLANILLLCSTEWSFRIRFSSSDCDGYLVQSSYPLQCDGVAGLTISLLPLLSGVAGVTTEGMYYPLNRDFLAAGSTRGVSNIATAESVSVSIESGLLLVLVNLQKI